LVRRSPSWSVGVVYAADGIRFLAVCTSRAALLTKLAGYVGEQAPQRLWAADASRVRELLSGGALKRAIELYFASVGGRWDEEWLHAEEINI
jgi:hypothetical protein